MRTFFSIPTFVVVISFAAASAITLATLRFEGVTFFADLKDSQERSFAFVEQPKCGEPGNAACSGSALVTVATTNENLATATVNLADATPATASTASSASSRLVEEMTAAAAGTPNLAGSTSPVPPVVNLAAWNTAAAVSVPPSPPPTVAPAAGQNRKATYLVVGSYRLAENADRQAAQLEAFSPGVAAAVVDGKVYFRVVTGPVTDDEIDGVRARLATSGIPKTWAISLCTADLNAPPCTASKTSARASGPIEVAVSHPIFGSGAD